MLPPTARERALARTYEGRDGRDQWETIRTYRAVLDAFHANRERPQTEICQEVGIPTHRGGRWLRGETPAVVKAIDTAATHGWLQAQPGDPTFEALVVLHAWTLAGGSIGSSWQLSIYVGDSDPRQLADAALTGAGVDTRVREQPASESVELQPARDGAALARVLHTLGSPVGDKQASPPTLPAWLAAVPRATQLRWARTYVSLRASQDSRHTRRVREARPPAYRDALATFFADLTGGEVARADRGVKLYQTATELLDVVPTIPGQSAVAVHQ
ncbi:hypothetical protein [Halosegnis longus]|uniref:Uncharacterized protein n=1 Tax=Halosegnis longus TaxID=2216012 RepID=A0AAJ4UVU9_9EURY|nr:hypothetical protein Nmn1133_06745 [Salella cibi]